jgi:putative transposase
MPAGRTALSASWSLADSMSRRANAWDNAPLERFFKTLKVEQIYQPRYETRAQARLDIIDWIEGYCNRQRPTLQLGIALQLRLTKR